jgi:hypothetical protein
MLALCALVLGSVCSECEGMMMSCGRAAYIEGVRDKGRKGKA